MKILSFEVKSDANIIGIRKQCAVEKYMSHCVINGHACVDVVVVVVVSRRGVGKQRTLKSCTLQAN